MSASAIETYAGSLPSEKHVAFAGHARMDCLFTFTAHPFFGLNEKISPRKEKNDIVYIGTVSGESLYKHLPYYTTISRTEGIHKTTQLRERSCSVS